MKRSPEEGPYTASVDCPLDEFPPNLMYLNGNSPSLGSLPKNSSHALIQVLVVLKPMELDLGATVRTIAHITQLT